MRRGQGRTKGLKCAFGASVVDNDQTQLDGHRAYDPKNDYNFSTAAVDLQQTTRTGCSYEHVLLFFYPIYYRRPSCPAPS